MDNWEIGWSISGTQKEYFIGGNTLSTTVRSAHIVFMCFVFISEKKEQRLFYKTGTEGFYNRD